MRLRVARKVWRRGWWIRDTTVQKAVRRVMRTRRLWLRHHPVAQYTAEAGVVGMIAFVEEWGGP